MRVMRVMGVASANEPADIQYRRLEEWPAATDAGWTGEGVARRFEAGTRGERYLELLSFGPAIARSSAAREVIRGLQRTGLEEGVLLDFGCGNAALRELLHASGRAHWSYMGMDVNATVIDSCRRRYPGDRFEVVADGEPLPLSDGSVDIALASGSLEMVKHPGKALRELRRVNRPWVMLYRVGVRKTPHGMYLQTVHHAWGTEEHAFHVFSEEELDAMIAAAGLEQLWRGVSPACGQWTAPDDPAPMRHYLYLLRCLPSGRSA
jgi:ubiquinone/menaquinone biosynthesis C-methylase UbiE